MRPGLARKELALLRRIEVMAARATRPHSEEIINVIAGKLYYVDERVVFQLDSIRLFAPPPGW